jgi:phage/plasmid-like protein (TIGR03299 family)
MAHQINFNKKKGTYSFAAHGEPAWHGLGQIVTNAMTAQQAISLANLDYEVGKANIQYYDEAGMPVQIDGVYSNYRKDNGAFLGLVKSRYEIVQNIDAFGFFDSIVDSGEAIYETAGALGNGERIFIMAKLPDDFEIGGEKIKKYILLSNSHDGSSSVIAGMTNIRVVCNNTLQAALKGLTNKVSIGHLSGAKDKLKEAHKVMGIASKYNLEVQEIFNRMTDVKMSEGQYREFFESVLKPEYKEVDETKQDEKAISTRLKNMVDATTQFALTHDTQTTDAANGTLWGAYNAVSGYYNYIKTFDSAEAKFNSQFFGTANTKMIKSFNEAVAILS